jgi:predicted HTH domain antitoxin
LKQFAGILWSMTVDLPDIKIGDQPLSPEQARVGLAVGLYASRQLTMGQAAKVAGIPYADFMRELGQHGVTINYTMENLLQDIETVRKRLGR